MPIFRGLEISVVASCEAKKLPEYPHPDGSSVRLVATDDLRNAGLGSPRPSDSSIISDGDPTRQKKVNPRIAVYIPSMPGAQFWLKYNVIRLPAPATHLYFKMFMNGRLITSWGILASREKNSHPNRCISGTVVRALYDPGHRQQDLTGAECDSVGIETRYFHFMHGLENKSAAEDGGLIEVQVFRSKGRRRRAPKMMEFRNQERYGIASPSGGLVENPQDATYYDWLLVDPRDAPYASFCFHYRSMNQLLKLQLIPRSDSRPQIPGNESAMSNVQNDGQSHVNPGTQTPRTPPFAFGVDSLDTKVFDEEMSGGDAVSEKNTPETYALKSPPILIPALPSSQAIPQPSKALRDAAVSEALRRPLPDPPKLYSRRSSQSSLRSSCPSLTPSLAQYVDNGDFGDDEVEVGVARTVTVASPPVLVLSPKRHKGKEEDSSSDYDNSPPSTIASPTPERPSPNRYMSTTGSVLERQIASFTSSIIQPSPRRVRPRIPLSASEGTLFADLFDSQLSTMKLTESEWMRRTPSPIQRKPLRLWSPRLEKKPSRSRLDENLRPVRYSDIGPRYSDERSSWDPRSFITKGETSADQKNKTADSSSNVQPNESCSKKDLNDQLETKDFDASRLSNERHTWESCRDSRRLQDQNEERPAGNWI